MRWEQSGMLIASLKRLRSGGRVLGKDRREHAVMGLFLVTPEKEMLTQFSRKLTGTIR